MPSKLILLGSGNSTGVPWLHCIMNPATRCSVCADCLENPHSRNVRNNPSAILQYAHPDGRVRNILIDCGKTFRESALKQLPAHGITSIDAVLLTHPHADAYLGLDDLRDVAPSHTIPVYLSETCFLKVTRAFTYLIKPPTQTGLFIASVDWRIITPFVPFFVEGLIVTPLPVLHGEPKPMLAFEFSAVQPPKVPRPLSDEAGADAQRLIYMSDVAGLHADTREYLRAKRVDCLVVDALAYKPYPTHFSVKQALLCALDLRVRDAVFVGMNHRIDYYIEDIKLQEWVKQLRETHCIPGTASHPDDWLEKHGVDRGSDERITRLDSAQYGYDGIAMHVRLKRHATRAMVEEEVMNARARVQLNSTERGSPVVDASRRRYASVAPEDVDTTTADDCMLLEVLGWQRPDPSKLLGIDVTTPASVLADCDCCSFADGERPPVEHALVTTYLSVPLPGWEENDSPSKSAEQKVTVHHTTGPRTVTAPSS